jgi:hypothetical protein
LPTPGIVGQEFENGSVVFVEMQGGLKLALFWGGYAGYFQDPDATFGRSCGIRQFLPDE